MQAQIKMQHRFFQISNAEKVISILSYFTMGAAGLIWIAAAFLFKKKLKPFLMFHAVQSIVIFIFLAVLNIAVRLMILVSDFMPQFLKVIMQYIINLLTGRFFIFGMPFNVINAAVLLLLIYISLGAALGRIFYAPILTNIMKRLMRSYMSR